MTRPKISTLLRWLGTLVGIVLFVWLLARQDWMRALAALGAIPLWALMFSLALYALSYGFNTLRWCILLWAQNVKIGYLQALKITWGGVFASNFLPSTIGGDGFRMLAVYPFTREDPQQDGKKSLAFGSVALDRLINMAAMACLIPISLTIFGAGVFSLKLFVFPPALTRLMERLAPKVAAAFQMWAARPAAFLWAFLAAWPSNLLPMAATWVLARALGMSVTYWQVVGVQTVTYFLSVLPISVNGLGVREVAYTTLYVALGASLEQASSLALLTRLLTTIITLPGAAFLNEE
ncbi:MAG: hypothetical protein CO094_08195 [Anaerolineae bacterium CG_4_9_14_3_um_filter_57_17]|nr:flippase-like domain-containing protein [bacterium]NCT19629.1 flippase-like domain-containing protein [bacterium]OIO87415.1 MAG: hypothetical protein AUK01_00300 [Anaerolineae bacterium CG2_30_57_67]PJB66054.1 MAG: hypothetical protein CO094_08195 [Anaerolineae bacterium CG_4_9_14_3_um_filter_57_17]